MRPRHHGANPRRAADRANDLALGLTLHVSGPGSHRRAHAAADPSDTISDFKFTPATITIHVGDTITWTNAGPTEHTATASNGSFDTGILKKGASASHTFTRPGTYAYICTIHPFMHGTVVVEASTATTTTPATTTPGSTTPATTTPTATPSSSTAAGGSPGSGSAQPAQSGAATLPMTGLDLAAVWITGVLLFGTGLLIRRKSRTGS